jgi:hypothetical protein
VLELHLWNEHVPPLPPAGADLAWAKQGGRLLLRSCRALAQQLERDPRLAQVQAVGGCTSLFVSGRGAGGEKVLRRVGFQASPQPHPLGRTGEHLENLHGWLLMWAFNGASVRHRRLLGMRRTRFWATRDHFLGRHRLERHGPA